MIPLLKVSKSVKISLKYAEKKYAEDAKVFVRDLDSVTFQRTFWTRNKHHKNRSNVVKRMEGQNR